jgi:hypothetical protein
MCIRNLNLINIFKGKFKLRIHERCRTFNNHTQTI